MVYYMHYLSLPKSLYSADQSEWEEEEPHNLSPIPSHALPPPHPPTFPKTIRYSDSNPHDSEVDLDGTSREDTEKENPPVDVLPLLLLAGYSYGALITVQLPSLSLISSLFASPELGTAASEIRLRAEELAKKQNIDFAHMVASLRSKGVHTTHYSPKHRRGRSLQPNDAFSGRRTSTSSGFRLGGEEADSDLRRPGHDSSKRRSFSWEPEKLRKSLDRVKSLGRAPKTKSSIKGLRGENSSPTKHASSGSGSSSSIEIISPVSPGVSCVANGQRDLSRMVNVGLEDMKVAYVLVSPLQGLVTKLATLWTFKSRRKESSTTKQGPSECGAEEKLVLNDTLAVFGDEDVFSSSKNLHTWAEKLHEKKDSKFVYAEVSGAGHFWHEEGVVDELRQYISRFVSGL
jgi:alpha/beta superfamily hydrolase